MEEYYQSRIVVRAQSKVVISDVIDHNDDEPNLFDITALMECAELVEEIDAKGVTDFHSACAWLRTEPDDWENGRVRPLHFTTLGGGYEVDITRRFIRELGCGFLEFAGSWVRDRRDYDMLSGRWGIWCAGAYIPFDLVAYAKGRLRSVIKSGYFDALKTGEPYDGWPFLGSSPYEFVPKWMPRW